MESEDIIEKKPSLVFSMRFLLAILVFFGYGLQYTQKIDMSVAIVCMVNHTALLKNNLDDINSTNLTNYNSSSQPILISCPKSEESSGKGSDGEFIWPKQIQGQILASYFYGYTLSNLPGGLLSLKFGGKYVNLLGLLIGSIATLLTPICAKYHFGALIAARFVTGIVHGVMWPAVASMWAHWAVPQERSTLISLGSAGSQIGNVVALPLGSFLCASGFLGGWPSIFYVFGIAGVVWSVAWFILTADKPSDHRFIKEREKNYIMKGTNVSKEKMPTPWKQIMTSKACIALFFGHVCSNWGTYLFLTNIPTYMNEVLKFDIKSNGGLSALPYLVFWAVIILSGIIADRLLRIGSGSDLNTIDTKKKIEVKRKLVRKLFNSIGFLVPMAAVIGLSFVTCQHPYLGVSFLVLGIAAIGCQYGAGFLVNYNDICGKYAGMVLGIGNTFASIPGILAPYLVGFVTKNQLQSEWRIVFLVTAGVYFIGAFVLFFFCETKLEPWAVGNQKSQPEEGVLLNQNNKEENNPILSQK